MALSVTRYKQVNEALVAYCSTIEGTTRILYGSLICEKALPLSTTHPPKTGLTSASAHGTSCKARAGITPVQCQLHTGNPRIRHDSAPSRLEAILQMPTEEAKASFKPKWNCLISEPLNLPYKKHSLDYSVWNHKFL